MINIPGMAVLLFASQIALTACQPYGALTNAGLESGIATPHKELASTSPDTNTNPLYVRDDIDRVILVARDTTTSESSTSAASTSTSSEISTTALSSDTSTAPTSSTATTTSSTSTITATSTSSTSTQSTTTSTPTTSSSSTTTTTTSTTRTATASTTSTTSAEIAEWNRRGNIAAIVFGCCIISLFAGISIVHCAKERAKSKRIAARELMKANAVSAEPLAPSMVGSTADLISNRSSIMFRDSPFGEQRPQTAYSALGSASNGWGRTPSPEQPTASIGRSTTVNGTSTADRQREPLV